MKKKKNRSLFINFTRTEEVAFNIDVHTFSADPILFASHTDVPDNAGFCTPPGHCLPAGALNISTCVGLPIISSPPHFLFSDPHFNKDVDGLSPNNERHNTFLGIEPTTGVLMRANKRFQFNVQLFEDERVS
jgi:hypothetical protein